MKFFVLIISIALVIVQIKAATLNTNKEEEHVDNSLDSSIECEERVCPRIYRPICVAVDDEKFNVASACHLENLACEYKLKMAKPGDKNIPKLRLVKLGECEEKEKEEFEWDEEIMKEALL